MKSRFPGVFAIYGLAALGTAQSVKLNDRLFGIPLGSVERYALAAGGTRAVFLADTSDTGAFPELHSVPLDGSAAPTLLTGNLSGSILDFAVSSSGTHVFVAARSADNVRRIFRLPAAGGTPTLLSQGGEFVAFPVVPTDEHVVFLAEFTTGVVELFSAPADASGPRVKLNGTLPSGGDVSTDPGRIQINPDGTRVVYLADQDANDVFDLYSVPTDGSSAAVRLNLTRPQGDVFDFRVAWDGLGVVYRADQDSENVPELYAVRIDGSLPPVKRSGLGHSVLDFQLSAGSDRLIWRSGLQLYSVGAIAGGTPVVLNPPLVAGGSVISARVSADGSRVVFVADALIDADYEIFGVPADGSTSAVPLTAPEHPILAGPLYAIAEGTGRAVFGTGDSFGTRELYGVPLDGSEPAARLHGDLPSGGTVGAYHGTFADGTVLFTASLETAGVDGLYSSAIDGSAAPVRLDESPAGDFIEDVRLASGNRVAFVRDDDAGAFERDELFSASALGGANARLSPELGEGEPVVDVLQYRVTDDGERAVFLAGESPSLEPNLHSTFADGSARSRQVHPVLPANASIDPGFRLSPDGEWVVYQLIVDGGFNSELHSARTAAPLEDHRLDMAPVPSASRESLFQVTPDSQRVVFAAQNMAGVLYVAPIDGSQAPELLDGGPQVFALTLSPDGAWVVYRGTTAGQSALYSAALDGHQGPTLLGPATGAFFVTSDSAHVLHVVVNAGVLELHGVPIDGSLPPVRLDDPADGHVTSYRPSGDGARAVYIANAAGKFELYSAPIAGGAPRVKLNGTLVPAGNVASFTIEPGTDRVLYVADQVSNDVYELFGVPADASAAPQKLSGSPSFMDVDGELPILFAAGRVVYARSTANTWRIHSTENDGSSTVALTPTLQDPSLDREMQLMPDGLSVVYPSRQRDPAVLELFRVPIDGSAPATVVSGPMVEDGDVDSYLVSPDGEHVLYRADQELDGVLELYSGWLARPHRRASAPTRSVVR